MNQKHDKVYCARRARVPDGLKDVSFRICQSGATLFEKRDATQKTFELCTELANEQSRKVL